VSAVPSVLGHDQIAASIAETIQEGNDITVTRVRPVPRVDRSSSVAEVTELDGVAMVRGWCRAGKRSKT
jgi:uncharacterized protein YabE (DUF348 family)